eukprot:g20387.t1
MKDETCYELEISQQNAELMHGIHSLSQELKWLASYNSVLREHIPSDLEPKVKNALENLSFAEWQPPADMAQWLRERLNSWTKKSTLTVTWITTLFEALGLLLAGPLADYIEPVLLIAFEGLVAFSGLFIATTLHSAHGLILSLLVVSFLKGILWPSLGSIIFSLDKEKQDVCFFCCALASRFAEALGDFGLGQLLWLGFHWRSALACFGGFLVAIFLGGIFCLHGLLAKGIHIEEPMSPSSPTWSASYGAKWFRLFVDFHGWLALLVLLGTSGLWAFSGYLSLLMQAQFQLDPGGAAMAASSLLAGTFLGLLLAGVVTYLNGREHGRLLQLIQANVALLCLVSMVMMPGMSLTPWVFFLLLTGAGAGPLLYLPYTVYCSQVLFGNLRIVIPEKAGQIMYDSTTAGFAVTAFCTMLLYRMVGKDSQLSHF